LFLLLATEGRLAGPFPQFAGWGDIITAWDLFGAADLLLAITLGVTAAEGSPLQIFHAAPGSAAMQQLPWSFVPTALVPFWLILHAIIWAQLRRLRSLGTCRSDSHFESHKAEFWPDFCASTMAL